MTIPVWGATISKVKDGRAIVDGAPAEWIAGTVVMVKDSVGKKVGRAKVVQAKDGRVLIEAEKGELIVGGEVDLPQKRNVAQAEDSPVAEVETTAPTKPSGKRPSSWGVAAVMTDQTMKVNFTSSSVTMKGTTMGALGYYEPGWDWPVRLRAIGGLTVFNLRGTASSASCDGSRTCGMDATFFSLGGEALYNFWQSRSLRAWVGAFGRGDLPLSLSTNAVKASGLTIAATYGAEVGLDWKLDFQSQMYFGLGPTENAMNSRTVSSSGLTMFAGYAHAF